MSHLPRLASVIPPSVRFPLTRMGRYAGWALGMGLLLFGTDFSAQAQGRKRARPTPPTPAASAFSDERITGTPMITSFWPISAPEGATIKVNGRNLHAAAAVLFNGISSPVLRTNGVGTEIITTVPVGGNSGLLRVLSAMTTGVGTFGMFNVSPVISNFSPSEWYAGTTITITGQGFQGTTSVEIGVGSGIFGQNLNVNAAGTQITCTVPARVSTLPQDMRYRLKITTPRGYGRSNLGMLRIRPTGIEEDQSQLVSSLWPNPAHDRVTVTLGPGSARHAVQLIDAMGRVVRTQEVTPGVAEVSFSLANLPAGAYTVRRGASARRLLVE